MGPGIPSPMVRPSTATSAASVHAGAGQEGFICAIQIHHSQFPFESRDLLFTGDSEDGLSCDTTKNVL